MGRKCADRELTDGLQLQILGGVMVCALAGAGFYFGQFPVVTVHSTI
jgi:hypothetical protein